MKKILVLFALVLFTSIYISCKEAPKKQIEAVVQNQASNNEMAIAVMEKHLKAVSNRDIETLASTLSPDGDMLLILPETEIIEKASGFIENQSEWFETTNWTFETQILHSEVGETVASMVVEAIYKEPERDGKPYFNRMHISYVLKKVKGDWFVIRDHMVTVEKSTDIK
jgi:ketosteroid isomerase-like protein